MGEIKNVLVKIESTDSISEVRIQKERFTVGRNPAADVFLSAVAVSRTHLVVSINENSISVEDPGSGNGSYLRGEKLVKGKPYLVSPTDKIQLGRGSDFLSFRLEAEPETMLTNNPAERHTATIRTSDPRELSFETLKTASPRKGDEKVRVDMPEGSISIHLEHEAKAQTKKEPETTRFADQTRTTAPEPTRRPFFQNPIASIVGNNAVAQARTQTQAVPPPTLTAPLDQPIYDPGPAPNNSSLKHERKAEPEHYKLLDAAHEQVRRLKAQAESESLRIIKNAHVQAGEIRVQAEAQAEDFIIQARGTAQEIMLQSEKDTQKVNREIQEKILKTLQEAQTDIEKLLTSARQTAFSIRKQAEADAAATRAQAQEKVETAVEEARDNAQAEMNELKESLVREMTGLKEIAEEEAEAILVQAHAAEKDLRTKAAAEVDALVEKARLQAESDAEGMLEEAKALIDKETKQSLAKIQEQKISLEAEIADLERNRANLDGFLHGHRARAEQEMESKRRSEEDAMAIRRNELEKELKEQRIAFEKIIKLDQREHERKLETLREELNTQKDQISKEVKDLREKADADYKRKIQQDEKEVSDLKMRMLEDAKNRRDEEERRFLSLKQHFKREMSRHLEMLLLPKLKESLKSESLPVHFGTLSEDIQKIVVQVLDNQNRPEGETLAMGAEQNDKELQRILRRHKIKRALTYSAPLLVAVFFVLKPGIAVRVHDTLLRKPAGQSAQELYLQKTLERREAKSRFTPSWTPNWKNTYADNALSTTGYMDFKLNSQVQDQWIRELNKFFTDGLGLSENTIVSFIGMESSLLLKLKNNLETIDGSSPNEGIQRLKDFEAETLTEMRKIIRTEGSWQKFKAFEKEFFEVRMKNSERRPAQRN